MSENLMKAALEEIAKWDGVGVWPSSELVGIAKRALASCDTHPKDGDVKQAPLVSGAVDAEGSETPNTSSSCPTDLGEGGG